MTTTGQQHPTTCHVCNAEVFVQFVDSAVTAVKMMTAVLPVPPARDCAVCGDVICVNCSAADCPHGVRFTSPSCRLSCPTYVTMPDHSDIYQLSLTVFCRSAILEAAAPPEHSAHIGTDGVGFLAWLMAVLSAARRGTPTRA